MGGENPRGDSPLRFFGAPGAQPRALAGRNAGVPGGLRILNRLFAWIFLAALAAVPQPAQAGRDVLRERSSRSMDATGVRSVRAENRHGDVTATPSPDGKIHVTAVKVVRSGSRAESERMARDLGVEILTGADEVAVKVRYPSRRSIRIGFWDLFSDFQVPSAEIRLELQVPRGVTLAVRNSSGDIRTEGLAGPQELDAASGDVRVFDASGPVRVGTSSGDVEARRVAALRIQTASGDVDVTDARGPADLRASSGDVTVNDARDSLRLATVSGDVTVRGAGRGVAVATTSGEVVLRGARGRVEVTASSGSVEAAVEALAGASITTGSGDIVLRLASGLGARLELQTSNGSLQMDAPIQVTSLSRRRVEGTLGAGGPLVALRSASGDIHVRTGEKTP